MTSSRVILQAAVDGHLFAPIAVISGHAYTVRTTAPVGNIAISGILSEAVWRP